MALIDYDKFSAEEPLAAQWAQWRKRLLALMAAERATLLWRLLGVDESTLASRPIFDDYVARDLLAHVAAWDDLYAQRTALVLAGKSEEIVSVELHERNAMLKARHAGWRLQEAIDACEEARRRFVEALADASDRRLHAPLQLPWAAGYPMRQWAIWRAQHDAGHAADVGAWRRANQFQPMAGPKALLLAALRAGRQQVEALVALVPEADRATHLISEAWTLKDILGHIADWEAYCISCIEAGEPLPQKYEGDGQRWNEAHAAVRRNQPWQQVWNDVQVIRQKLLALLASMSQEELESAIDNPWGAHASAYGWAHAYLAHEREHAGELCKKLLTDSGTNA